MRTWGTLALLVGCSVPPPGPDELACGWEYIGDIEASPDECARFLGTTSMRFGSDACEARGGPAQCVILQPGESRRVYTDPSVPGDVARLTHGSCETLLCE